MKTPQENFPQSATALGVPELWLKREDLHHFGSHKGRSIPQMIDHYWHKEAKNTFVISSSGNAARAAALYTQHHNKNNPDRPIELTIFVGEKINEEKLNKINALTDIHIKLVSVKNPKQSAFQMEKNSGALFLRQSTDDEALNGYHELAKELDHIPNIQAIFVPTSSGTTAQALCDAFSTLTQKPEIHIVQTTACHPIAQEFDSEFVTTDTSIADAIVDTIAVRKITLISSIRASQGSGWIASDAEIQNAQKLVFETTGIRISPTSALSIAGLQKALRHKKKYSGAVICLITGA
jgi:threonine dehydratase